MGIEMKGFNEVMRNLNHLANNPQQLLEGQTFEKPHEVTCEFCEKEYVVTLPLKIERVEGTRGYGPGGSIKADCPACGKENEYTWTDSVIDMTLTD